MGEPDSVAESELDSELSDSESESGESDDSPTNAADASPA